jgi:DNA-binding XRE family transcriptional regulator
MQPFGNTSFDKLNSYGYFMYQRRRYAALMSMGQQPRRHSALSRALAEEIRAQRRAVEMSQEELGKRAGVSRGQVVRIESGERVLDVTQVADFAAALNLDIITLFQGAEARVRAAGAGDVGQASGQ